MTTREMVEKFAAIEHKRWAGWQNYLHSRGIMDTNGEGYLCLPMGLVEHWERQIKTPYEELSEFEKQSDRDQVMRYLPIIESLIKSEKLELLYRLKQSYSGTLDAGDAFDLIADAMYQEQSEIEQENK